MHYHLLKIALSTVTVLFFSSSLLAAECINNVNSCTPKQLCEAATSTDSGKKVWTTKPSFTEHLKAAKSIGIDCGVVEVIASCNSDAELCTFSEVCKRAIQVNGGKTNWMTTTAAAPYVAIAKKYGMSCGVKLTNKKQVNCFKDEQTCSDAQLCRQATVQIHGRPITWEEKVGFNRYVIEARKRGLTCNVETKCASSMIGLCSDKELCSLAMLTAPLLATKTAYERGFYCFSGSKRNFPVNNSEFCTQFTSRGSMSGAEPYWLPEFAEIEGKRRNVSCGVGVKEIFVEPNNETVRHPIPRETSEWKSSLSAGTNIAKKVDNSEIVILVQKELNRLGCKAGIADGVEGPNTRAAINRFNQNVNVPTVGLSFHQLIKVLKSFPDKACTTSSSEEFQSNQQIAPAPSNSAELKALRLERQQIEANLRAMEELIAREKRAANAPYKSCLANCMLNNRAGSGFAAALSGMGECNNSCAPLKYGGAVIPPSWERNQRRLKTIDCTITQMSKNQATARCNQF
jgi:hypothetical protein